MVRLIEEIALNAWPAPHVMHYDGWLLRFGGGYTRRANSVNPLYPSTLDLPEKIAYCEAVYRSLGQAATYKMTPAVEPADLDSVLADAGYACLDTTSVQILELENLILPASPPVHITEHFTDGWLETMARLNEIDERRIPLAREILTRISVPTGFAVLQDGGERLAVGLAVLERGYLGLFNIATAPHARNQGWATQLMLYLLHWGKAMGAHHSYLQVMENNSPALRLYSKLGYKEMYRYWYRVRPL